jgi:hypothetical protein
MKTKLFAMVENILDEEMMKKIIGGEGDCDDKELTPPPTIGNDNG